MRVGYARVSTIDQNPELQLEALRRAGCEKVFTEKASGARDDRPELARILTDVLRADDTLVVWKLDRLARSLKKLIATAEELERQKIGLVSLTLTGLKRLMEVVADAGVLLSVLLVGHPRLRNDLRRPQMEEIGYRTTTFDYEGIGSEHRRDYVAWLLGACAAEGVKIGDLMDEDAIDLIADRLRTPLQVEMHLTLAFEQGFRLGTKPVTAEIVEQVLSRTIDDLEPTLTRNGYDAGSLASQLNARPSDIRAFLAGTLDPEHTHELTEQLRQAGVPV